MKYVYHYHGKINKADQNTTTHIDGILTCKEPIISYERYIEAKALIAEDEDLDKYKLVIDSLTFLHKVKD